MTAPAAPPGPATATQVNVWHDREGRYKEDPGPGYAVLHVRPSDLAGDVAELAAERMGLTGVFTLFRSGEALAATDRVGRFVTGYRTLVLA